MLEMLEDELIHGMGLGGCFGCPCGVPVFQGAQRCFWGSSLSVPCSKSSLSGQSSGQDAQGATGKEQRLGGLGKSAGTHRSGKEGMLFTPSDPIFLREQQQNAAWHRFASLGRVKSRARS